MLWLALLLQDPATAVLEKSAAAMQKHDAVGLVVQLRFSDPTALPLRFEGVLGKGEQLRMEQVRGNERTTTVADEKFIWVHESRSNQYLKVPKPRRGLTLGATGLNTVAQAFYDPEFGATELRGAVGVKLSADGLTVSWTKNRMDWTYTIDATTKLPKRVTNGNKDLTVTCEVVQVDATPKTDASTFTFKIAEGAVERKLFGGKAAEPGRVAPDFELAALAGGKVKLSDSKGKPALVVFWYADDVESREELSRLQDLGKAFPDAAILAVDRGDTEKRLKALIKISKPAFAVLHADGETEPVDEIAQKYGVIGYPTTVLVGKNGRVAERWVGFDEAAIKKALEAACK